MQLKALNKNQFDALKLKEATHRDELEKRSRMEWRAHQEKVSLDCNCMLLLILFTLIS